MAIEVRIPTILRSYTGGAKAVEGSGATLDELLNNLDAAHGGLRERLVDGEKLRRFVNVYLNDEDVSARRRTTARASPPPGRAPRWSGRRTPGRSARCARRRVPCR